MQGLSLNHFLNSGGKQGQTTLSLMRNLGFLDFVNSFIFSFLVFRSDFLLEMGKTGRALACAYLYGRQCSLVAKAAASFTQKYPDEPNPFDVEAVGLDKVTWVSNTIFNF